jgi:hypothetical protein
VPVNNQDPRDDFGRNGVSWKRRRSATRSVLPPFCRSRARDRTVCRSAKLELSDGANDLVALKVRWQSIPLLSRNRRSRTGRVVYRRRGCCATGRGRRGHTTGRWRWHNTGTRRRHNTRRRRCGSRQRTRSWRHRLRNDRLTGQRRHRHGIHVRPARAALTGVTRPWRGGSRARRRRRLDAHRAHPRSLRRRLRVRPGEVWARLEVLNVVVHVPARRQRHTCVFDLAADRSHDPAQSQRRPKRRATPLGPSRRSHAGQPHCFHPPWHLRRSL